MQKNSLFLICTVFGLFKSLKFLSPSRYRYPIILSLFIVTNLSSLALGDNSALNGSQTELTTQANNSDTVNDESSNEQVAKSQESSIESSKKQDSVDIQASDDSTQPDKIIIRKLIERGETAEPNVAGNESSFEESEKTKPRGGDLYVTLLGGGMFAGVYTTLPIGPYKTFESSVYSQQSIDYVYRFSSPYFVRIGTSATELVFSTATFISADVTASFGRTFLVGDYFISPFGTLGVGYSTQFFYQGSPESAQGGYGGSYLTVVAGGGMTVNKKDSIYSYSGSLNVVACGLDQVSKGVFTEISFKNYLVIEPAKSPVIFLLGLIVMDVLQPNQPEVVGVSGYLNASGVILDFGIRIKI